MVKKSKSKNTPYYKNYISQMEPWFDNAEAHAVYKYVKSGGWLTEYTKTQELEKMIADYTGVKYCIMTPNGTISLMIALMALGVGSGDEVIVPNLTMIATANAAAILGIKPVLVDVEPETLCLDLKKAERRLSKNTKAVIYVAFNGRSGDMEKIVKFCKSNNLFLIEDAAQALGSFYKGTHLGTFGDIGSFSFSVPKIITTGQGGALITNNGKLMNKIRKIKDFGRLSGGNDTHNDWGWNFKFTDLQAVVGIEQMKKLPWRARRKKEIFEGYRQGLKSVPQINFLKTDLNQTTPWFIDIFTKNPDRLALYLKECEIGTRKIYPMISSQKIYRQEYLTKEFPISKRFSSRGLWLPSSSKLTNEQVDFVVSRIKKYFTLSA